MLAKRLSSWQTTNLGKRYRVTAGISVNPEAELRQRNRFGVTVEATPQGQANRDQDLLVDASVRVHSIIRGADICVEGCEKKLDPPAYTDRGEQNVHCVARIAPAVTVP